MAIIFSYPTVSASDLHASDRFILSQMNQTGNPTKSVTLSDLANFITTTGEGTGTTDFILKWNDGPGGIIGDSIMRQNITGTEIEVGGDISVTGNANINQDLTVAANATVNTDLTVDQDVQFGGATDFRFFATTGRIGLGTSSPNFKMDIGGGDLRIEENYGIRFGGTGSNGQNWNIRTTGDPFGGIYPGTFMIGRGGTSSNPYFQITTGPFAPNNPGQITFNQYGSGNFTGTEAFNLSVDASGNIIETTGSTTGTGTTRTLSMWTDGPNGVLGDSFVRQDAQAAGGTVYITPTDLGTSGNFEFGTGGSFSSLPASDGYEFRTQNGGFYKKTFKFESKEGISIGRSVITANVTLDVGDTSDTKPAAWFRNGVVLSNNPGGLP